MNFEEVFVDVPWGKLSVLCYGEKELPSIVLVHGNQDSADTFLPLIEHFPKTFRLIIPDLPSCGHSSPFPPGRPLDRMDLIAPIKFVIDFFKLEKFVYIGHSMGFQLGVIFNAVYPNHITKFIALDSLSPDLINPEHFESWYMYKYDRFYDKENYKKFTSPTSTNIPYTYEKALSIIMTNRGLTEAAGKMVLRRCLIPTDNGLYRFCWDQRYKIVGIPLLSKEFLEHIFKKITFPHLTIFASESLKIRHTNFNFQNFKHEIESNPNYRVTVVDGNHDVHLNNPEIVAKHIIPFLNGNFGSKKETYALLNHFTKLRKNHLKNKKSKL